jgi:hypothetical protein
LAIGGFDPKLGRVGSNLLSMEEAEFIGRLRRHGVVTYTGGAAVDHVVPAERLRLTFFVRRSYWQARSERIVEPIGVDHPLRRLASGIVRALTAGHSERPYRLVVLLCAAGYLWGALDPRR